MTEYQKSMLCIIVALVVCIVCVAAGRALLGIALAAIVLFIVACNAGLPREGDNE
jgi:hypothetical protein